MLEEVKPTDGAEITGHFTYSLSPDRKRSINIDSSFYQVFVDTGREIPKQLLKTLDMKLFESKNIFRVWNFSMN